MRPLASTAVASMQKIAAPDSANELMWVKCQSLASPSTDEYWHIGATMMRLGRLKPRSLIGENKALMGDFRTGGKLGALCVTRRSALLNPPLLQPSPYGLMPAALINARVDAVSRLTRSYISTSLL